MTATHFDAFLADGTDGGYTYLRLTDGQVIAIKTPAGADQVDVTCPTPSRPPTATDGRWKTAGRRS
ncbi:hypothetical protein ACR6C2_08135 [Streptomyces sp. INA 01156]